MAQLDIVQQKVMEDRQKIEKLVQKERARCKLLEDQRVKLKEQREYEESQYENEKVTWLERIE